MANQVQAWAWTRVGAEEKMNTSRRLSFLVGVVIGVAIALLEFRGIATLVHEGGEWLRQRMQQDGSGSRTAHEG
jgi:hypothetical protein